MDSFSVESSEGWFSRIGDSIKSVLAGLALFLLAFPLLWWNEGRAVQTAQSLDEGKSSVVSVDPSSVDPQHDGKLVHVSGVAKTDNSVKDVDFGVDRVGIKLVRNVEMYQWVEHKESTSKKKVGGKVKKKTTYTYKQEWTKKQHDSSDFEVEKGHINPSIRYPSTTKLAQNVTLGAFSIPDVLVSKIGGEALVLLDDAALEKVTPALRKQTKLADGAFYIRPGADGDFDTSSPSVGDHRVTFKLAEASEVSLVAQQSGSTFTPFQTKAGDTLDMLKMGKHSASEMFTQAEEANKTLTWILRAVGFFMMAFGVGLIFMPLRVIADVVPIFGQILQVGIVLVALVVAIPLTLITIAIAWIVVRPLLGGALLAGGALVIGGAVFLSIKRKAQQKAALPSPAAAGTAS